MNNTTSAFIPYALKLFLRTAGAAASPGIAVGNPALVADVSIDVCSISTLVSFLRQGSLTTLEPRS
jgi:hypothetical protein